MFGAEPGFFCVFCGSHPDFLSMNKILSNIYWWGVKWSIGWYICGWLLYHRWNGAGAGEFNHTFCVEPIEWILLKGSNEAFVDFKLAHYYIQINGIDKI